MKRILFGIFLILTALASVNAAEPANKVLARIALLSDPHVNRRTNGMDSTFKMHFEDTIQQVNAEKVDFVLITGDLTQGGAADEMNDFKAHLKKFKAPVSYVPGNHDVGHKFNSGKAEGTVTAERVAAFEQKLGPSFFTKTQSGVRVIGINASIFGSGFERETAMWKMLEKELSKPTRKPTLLFSHYPLFVGTPEEPGGVYWNVEPAPRKRLLELMDKAGVKLFLSGHLHRELVNRSGDRLFFSTGPISFGLPKGKQKEGWTLVTLYDDGKVETAFHAVVE